MGSWERYSVSATGNDDEILIEMSSRFSEQDKYSADYRIKLSLGECLASTVHRMTWRFREFSYKESGEWCQLPWLAFVEAFEEKFDLSLMGGQVSANRIRKTRLQSVAGLGMFGPTGLVQTRRDSHTGAWYACEPPQHAGLAAFKVFADGGFANENTEGKAHYSFELVEMGNNFDADANSAFSE